MPAFSSAPCTISGDPFFRMAVFMPPAFRPRSISGTSGNAFSSPYIQEFLSQFFVLNAERRYCVAKCVLDVLPKEHIFTHFATQPRILCPSCPPQVGERFLLIAQIISLAGRGGNEIEQGAKGVEDASVNILHDRAHRRNLRFGAWKRRSSSGMGSAVGQPTSRYPGQLWDKWRSPSNPSATSVLESTRR